ncbi:alpha/beta hydrolase [Kineococcus aurantiacus]|uniref:Pimeloyl-ACP methyl ester carboxylesterase n=1 Tax=Kineococcus aurantiacus TaxID=37633 RepID=A0A7Y9DKE7_9ACTN|nr:alpha/beta hydrolase [Kineococcus aurantiacus]NYD22210.1 pimeloyl-ACP methyl ester carboxylesterase [Kineococcus aurantiacus]
MRTPRAVSALAVLVLALSGCSALGASSPDPRPVGTATAVASENATDPALAAFYGQRLQWVDCSGGFECTRLTVPVDYADPAGATASLAVVRTRTAAEGEDRLGSLVLNPGGPGASGVEYARAARTVVSQDVRDHFDVVGLDPRGVGESDPLRCLRDRQVDRFLATDPTPDDPAEVQALSARTTELGRGCAASGELAAHVDTLSAAKDLDVLRAALGDDKLNYLGKSYGTYLGAWYAEQFPQRVGRFVLDGAIDPALSSEQLNAGQAAGFEVALRSYVRDCQSGRNCPLTGGVDDGVAQVRRFLEGLDAEPLPTGTGRPLGQGLGYLAVANPLYAPQLWPQLSKALKAAFAGDGSVMLAQADAYTHRSADGRYADNSATVIYAVNCLDRDDDESEPQVAAAVEEFARDAPTFGPYLAWGGLACTNWPVAPVGQVRPVHAQGAGPIVVVGTTRDPATPYAWARSLAGELSSGRLLTYDGDGHTAYATGSSCVDSAVDTYLIAGTAPDEGTTCD